MNIKIKKVKSVQDNSSIKQTVKKAEKKTGGSSLDIKIRRYSSKPKKKGNKVEGKGTNPRDKQQAPYSPNNAQNNQQGPGSGQGGG